jgi:hypothetical protein
MPAYDGGGLGSGRTVSIAIQNVFSGSRGGATTNIAPWKAAPNKSIIVNINDERRRD